MIAKEHGLNSIKDRQEFLKSKKVFLKLLNNFNKQTYFILDPCKRGHIAGYLSENIGKLVLKIKETA